MSAVQTNQLLTPDLFGMGGATPGTGFVLAPLGTPHYIGPARTHSAGLVSPYMSAVLPGQSSTPLTAGCLLGTQGHNWALPTPVDTHGATGTGSLMGLLADPTPVPSPVLAALRNTNTPQAPNPSKQTPSVSSLS